MLKQVFSQCVIVFVEDGNEFKIPVQHKKEQRYVQDEQPDLHKYIFEKHGTRHECGEPEIREHQEERAPKVLVELSADVVANRGDQQPGCNAGDRKPDQFIEQP